MSLLAEFIADITLAWWLVIALAAGLIVVSWQFYRYHRACLVQFFELNRQILWLWDRVTAHAKADAEASSAAQSTQPELAAQRINGQANGHTNGHAGQSEPPHLASNSDDGQASAVVDPLQVVYSRIIKALAVEKVFQDPELDVAKLAQHVCSNQKYVSQAIAKYSAEGSYYELINHHRIQLAVRLLQGDDATLTVSTIAEECGFSSRSTFYSAFRQMVGMTPTDYRKQLDKTRSAQRASSDSALNTTQKAPLPPGGLRP